ncbi:hypothetical protein K458DRAFT_437493 [Lentithecium fluviatile CBS 122367]|uniref:Uncharacterized protein n=1 Tax=Lentithecium fluviatile CBS 122367 TaxID=1168545 RepID=A0A6G1IE89_9PLEO|nr:hypothetical protein K458DRAFT_437493 [Lentithecium fluviatile CBS 122367]
MAPYLPINKIDSKPQQPLYALDSRDTRFLLRYRKRTAILIVFYVSLLLIPWAITCVLSVRPLNAPSYFNQEGFTLTEISQIRYWMTAVDVLNSIASTVTIPILSALLAQAAVVYTQRRDARQALSIRHLFALADRGWSDIPTLWDSLKWSEPGSGASRTFLWFGAALLAISATQQPLYQALVPTETISIVPCSVIPSTWKRHSYKECGSTSSVKTVGLDPEPAQMAAVQQNEVLPKIISDLAFVSRTDVQPNLWVDSVDANVGWKSDSSPRKLRTLGFTIIGREAGRGTEEISGANVFVTALETNTTTGVLRQHIMRMNSSVECTHIERASFPSTCAGSLPFTASYSRTGVGSSSLQVCAPGQYGTFPWSLSRNRQDLSEEIFIDIQQNSSLQDRSDNEVNVTLHCEAKTTRGYFELGNIRNGNTYGPLLERWPSKIVMETEYNDYANGENMSKNGGQRMITEYRPSEEDAWSGGYHPGPLWYPSAQWNMSGPLMMSAMALFGNTSTFYSAFNRSRLDTNISDDRAIAAWKNACNLMPFNKLFRVGGFSVCNAHIPMESSDQIELTQEWLYAFNHTPSVEQALSTSLYFANKEILSSPGNTIDAWDQIIVGRTIYSSPGVSIQKPTMTTTVIIVLSTLIGLQMLGLTFLAYFIYHVPTWTYILNAVAVARIGASLEPSCLPPIGPVNENDLNRLASVSGLVGIMSGQRGRSHSQTRLKSEDSSDCESVHVNGQQRDTSPSTLPRSDTQVSLALGAPGVITRKVELTRGRSMRKAT